MLNPLSLDRDRISAIIGHIPGLPDAPCPAVRRLKGGGNGQVYLVEAEDGSKYVAKRYYRHPDDPRDRLKAEFQSLTFMWRHGLRCIPRALAQDPDHDLAFYEYIPGQPPASTEITGSDIEAITDFLYHINQLKDKDDSRTLPLASEACISARGALDIISFRLKRLESVAEISDEHVAMKVMIREDVAPLFRETANWLERERLLNGIDLDAELPVSDQTLSPSDYGFHNALRRDDGRLVFIDFEYFGWDDPAKMILDFLLHPAREIKNDLKELFFRRMLDFLDRDGRLLRRIGYYQGLMGLKWVLILLNEFRNTEYGRRQFAHDKILDRSIVLALQMEKAKRMLAWTRGVYGKTDPAF